MINSEQVTFSKVLSDLKTKADGVGVTIEPLNDMFVMFTSIVEITARIQRFGTKFMADEMFNRILKKVPAIRSREHTFSINIKLINHLRETNIKPLIKKFNDGVAFELKNDEEFVDSFQNWNENPPNRTHIIEVQRTVDAIKLEYDDMQKHIEKFVKRANVVLAENEVKIGFADQLFKSILEDTYNEFADVKDKLNITTKDLYQYHTFMFDRMDTLEGYVKMFNMSRLKWAEFIIGMRETLSSRKAPVKSKLKRKSKKKLGGFLGF